MRRESAQLSAERWEAMTSIFADAVELSSAERPAFIAQACGTDAELRREVESLLAAHESDGKFLESPAIEATDRDAPDLAAQLQNALGSGFHIERELAGGGMSRVFVAEETKLGRRVVVKVLPPELRAGLSAERFHRETRLAAALRHPHIVPLLAAGEAEDGLVYFTMPYIEGESLQHRLERDGRLSLGEVVPIVREVADALAYAHANGVIHRDIKPANVLIDGGHVVVADFGVAKAIALALGEVDRAEQAPGAHELSSPLTVAGLAIGTPAYMSLEQALGGDDVDARSDVYSLGCMTFEMLTGRLPFGSAGVYGIADPETEPPPTACAHCPELPPAVDGVLGRALAHNVRDRYGSTTALAEALGAAAVPVPGTDSREDARPTRPRWRRSWIAAAALAATATAAAGAVALRRVWTAAPTIAAIPGAGPDAGSGDAVPAAATGPKLAVLPFENVGPADDAYFAQGVSDELTSRLTGVSGVRVMSPGSTRQYRNTTKSRPDVGRELGADYLLEGHVRWDRADSASRRVRVTVELIRSRDGSSVWADRYEAKTEDLFAVEGTIGERVAAALEVALDEPERRTISARPTENFEAYSLFLHAEELRREPDVLTTVPRAIAMYERAVTLDSNFALAFARLALTHGDLYWSNIDRTARRLAQMRPAAEKAVQLAPDLPEAHLALGMYYYRALRDYDRALAEFSAGLRRQPGNSELLGARAAVLRRQGRFVEAAANFVRTVELDPRSPEAPFGVAGTLGPMRDYPNAVRYAERTIALSPKWTGVNADRAMYLVAWHGDVAEGRRALDDALAAPDGGAVIGRMRFHAAMLIGSNPADSAVLRKLSGVNFNGDTSEFLVWKADWARRHGDAARSLTYADSGRIILERRVAADPAEPRTRMLLALAYALLGRKADALREGTKAVEILPVSRDALDGADLQEDLAYVETLVGEHDAAVKRIAYLLTIPSELSVPFLRADPMWDLLRANPGFQKLIAASR